MKDMPVTNRQNGVLEKPKHPHFAEAHASVCLCHSTHNVNLIMSIIAAFVTWWCMVFGYILWTRLVWVSTGPSLMRQEYRGHIWSEGSGVPSNIMQVPLWNWIQSSWCCIEGRLPPSRNKLHGKNIEDFVQDRLIKVISLNTDLHYILLQLCILRTTHGVQSPRQRVGMEMEDKRLQKSLMLSNWRFLLGQWPWVTFENKPIGRSAMKWRFFNNYLAMPMYGPKKSPLHYYPTGAGPLHTRFFHVHVWPFLLGLEDFLGSKAKETAFFLGGGQTPRWECVPSSTHNNVTYGN